jgi:hypothetical protein
MEKAQKTDLEQVAWVAKEIARQRHRDGAEAAAVTLATAEQDLRMDRESTLRRYRIWSQRRLSWPVMGDQGGSGEPSPVAAMVRGAAVPHNFH